MHGEIAVGRIGLDHEGAPPRAPQLQRPIAALDAQERRVREGRQRLGRYVLARPAIGGTAAGRDTTVGAGLAAVRGGFFTRSKFFD
jgi:hypothetical protein